MRKQFLVSVLAFWSFLFLALNTTAANSSFFGTLEPGEKISGFVVENQYLNQNGQGIGGRFVSDRYGFIVDLFAIQSVPQAFYWIKTPPTDDRGEPHTCEHLLLGKGNVGRDVAEREEMLLGNSTAYTDQLVTCYHFNTIGGSDAFYSLFRAKLNALVNPDFTDEEIRREVAHIGVNIGSEGTLSLDEKGTVYTEMVSNYEKPWSYLWEPIDEIVFGADHPCSNVSGGRPDAIRQMIPQNLRDFHSETHILSNMGAIVCIPPNMDPKESLKKLDAILGFVQNRPSPKSDPSIKVTDLPPAAPVEEPGTIHINGYPAETEDDPGEILLSWPATLDYDLEEKFLLEFFLSGLANGASSDLYGMFFNTATKEIDLGAGYCFGSVSDYPGHPIRIDLGNIDADKVTEPLIDSIRVMIIEKIASIASMKPGSSQLVEFNSRVSGMLSQRKRRYGRILDTPPQFGFRRGPASFWLSHLEDLESNESFKKSITLSDLFAKLETRLATDENIWSPLISKWQLTSVTPYVVAIKPDVTVIDKMAADKAGRLDEFTRSLEKKFHTNDPQKAIRLYKQEFDSATVAIEEQTASKSDLKFLKNPPLSLDPDLNSSRKILGGIKSDEFLFDNMNSATVGLALDLKALPDSLLLYVPVLPDLITSIGVNSAGKRVSYREMETQIRNEVLGFNSYYSTSDATGRSELVVRTSGANRDETIRAIEWIEDGLFHSLIDNENLPRIRDVVSQKLNVSRTTMRGGEEGWVDSPFNALRLQSNHRFLAASSFLTQAHFLQRLKWRLASPENPFERASLLKFTRDIKASGQGKSRTELEILLSETEPPSSYETARQAADDLLADLKATLALLPDESIVLDWEYLLDCATFDFGYGTRYAIRDLQATLADLAQKNHARIFVISNGVDQLAIEHKLSTLADKIPIKPTGKVVVDERPVIKTATIERGCDPNAIYLGLINSGTRNGLIYFSSSFHKPYDSSPDGIFDALAGRLYGGGGAHGFFMRTWGAGLAYSNGVAYRDRWGAVRYYAERCPDAAETMKFVVSILNNAKPDPSLLEYVVALAFGESNAASTYEERGETYADDLADGFTPEKIAEFRRAVLLIKKDPKAPDEIWNRMGDVYGRILIGYGKPKQASVGNSLFLIGPEDQMTSMESLISATEGSQNITRIYPRDFWIRQ